MSDYLQSGIISERSKVSMTVTGKKKYTHGTRATGYSGHRVFGCKSVLYMYMFFHWILNLHLIQP